MRHQSVMSNHIDMKSSYVGNEAQALREQLTLSYPIEHGIITNMDNMERIWEHVFSPVHLGVSPEDHPVLLTEAPPGPKANREKMTQIMFERLQTPSLYIGVQPVLSLYCTNRQSGTVVESGEGITWVVPIFEGYWLPHATLRMDVAGRDVTECLRSSLQATNNSNNNSNNENDGSWSNNGTRGDMLWKSAGWQTVTDVKEKLARVAYDYAQEIATTSTTTPPTTTTATVAETPTSNATLYQLPDGQELVVSNSGRFQCAECMFQPALFLSHGKGCVGVHEVVRNAIMRCDTEIRDLLWGNVVLSGGNTMLNGFAERLEKELRALIPPETPLYIDAPATRVYGAWLGGSVLASVAPPSLWISKQEYEETGPSIVHRKCF